MESPASTATPPPSPEITTIPLSTVPELTPLPPRIAPALQRVSSAPLPATPKTFLPLVPETSLPDLQVTPSSPLPPSASGVKQAQHSLIAKSLMSSPSSSLASSYVRETYYLSPPHGSGGVGPALSDTPATTAPNSPRIRATTLDIPGLTKSKVSPDGRIANRDVGAKLIIVMVGLPARGKSYVTKKLARYLNWLQHDTKIFNVGNRRRIAAGAHDNLASTSPSHSNSQLNTHTNSPERRPNGDITTVTAHALATTLASGTGLISHTHFSNLTAALEKEKLEKLESEKQEKLLSPDNTKHKRTHSETEIEGGIDQSAAFFDPNNKAAAELREKVAMETLDELLDYVLNKNGSVGILDATNSTLERRQAIMNRIRESAGKEIGVLFLESECHDEKLLEANMCLKLSGPDYKGQDPEKALADFKKRGMFYKSIYVPLGEYEEKNGMPFIKMIDVGRKVVCHQIRGFLAGQTVSFLLNFNLAHRQIWITRHGESTDNVTGKIGGDAGLSESGREYARTLTQFMEHQRRLFRERQLKKHSSCNPMHGSTTPPYPEYTGCCASDENGVPLEKNFCVWTSMLLRSIETASYFDDEAYDVKQMRMLNELSAGVAEGMTYKEICRKWPEEYEMRRKDKLRYRYPGAGGESYLDVINRLRTVIGEVERMTDHVLLVVHRVVARVLLAYFLGLDRDDVAKLVVPLGMLYVLEPKPYGVEFRAYKYNKDTQWFDTQPDYKLKNEDHQDVRLNLNK
ncbi:6-phosphofructo-2-kinase [Rhizina undulata]